MTSLDFLILFYDSSNCYGTRKGTCREKNLSRAQEIASLYHDMLSFPRDATSCARDKKILHVPSRVPYMPVITRANFYDSRLRGLRVLTVRYFRFCLFPQAWQPWSPISQQWLSIAELRCYCSGVEQGQLPNFELSSQGEFDARRSTTAPSIILSSAAAIAAAASPYLVLGSGLSATSDALIGQEADLAIEIGLLLIVLIINDSPTPGYHKSMDLADTTLRLGRT